MIEVTAALIRRGNRILIARRPANDHLAGLWEFPGGKIEPGEAPEECLRREILEELSIEIKVGRYFTESTYKYPQKSVHLLAFWAELTGGEVQALFHDEVKWVTFAELSNLNFAPADIPIVERLRVSLV
ncbi:8-oxo-dGTP diphosphatase MutT [Sporomusa sp.]|uniref:8-oxo-dGTP diphosphatase MutT n=1 Tax=Sporomusa sp. TaxID=2078658 RepID=UPI002BF4317C|nr:8-oxo-dGTP diphosphatase MutT [Sporomusa sp.]HWR09980.1 8-oxo-dGTP diphosphatase MutT [Sporomusa sp.]